MAKLSTNTGQTVDAASASRSGPWREAWRTFRRNQLALAGLIIIVFFIVLAFLAPYIAPYDYKEQVLQDRLQAPSAEHWFGTDDLGRDVFSRVIHGARISLWVGFFSVIGSIIAGALL